VENNKLQEIRSQLSVAWRQLQPKEQSNRSTLDSDETPVSGEGGGILAPIVEKSQHGEESLAAIKQPEAMSRKSLLELARRGITKVNDSKDLFSEVTAPISKLNLPRFKSIRGRRFGRS
jgi:hypothetical protein